MACRESRSRRPRHIAAALDAEGQDYVSRFGERQTGTGPYADQIAARFELALKRFGLNLRHLKLRTDQFRPPGGAQLSLF